MPITKPSSTSISNTAEKTMVLVKWKMLCHFCESNSSAVWSNSKALAPMVQRVCFGAAKMDSLTLLETLNSAKQAARVLAYRTAVER